MPLYEITPSSFRPIAKASFVELKLTERGDLQRLLRTQIDVLGEDLYVLAEEFGDWDESRRRIDLLAIDKAANLVVIELKRTADGGHMDLQAIRYASMVSTMTLERAVEIHAAFLEHIGGVPVDAERLILEFLGWEERDEDRFADDVRILLVSEDFGKEMTTAVLWLRDRDIDIRCVRLRPYSHGEMKMIDVQQIIPLPEAQEYQVQVREKEQQVRKSKTARGTAYLKFWQQLVALARAKNTRHANRKPSEAYYLSAAAGISGLSFSYVVTQESASVELYIDVSDGAKNKNIFDQFLARKAEIETQFGHELSWERLDEKRACRIKYVIGGGGMRSLESEWPSIQQEMVRAMGQLELALKPAMEALRV